MGLRLRDTDPESELTQPSAHALSFLNLWRTFECDVKKLKEFRVTVRGAFHIRIFQVTEESPYFWENAVTLDKLVFYNDRQFTRKRKVAKLFILDNFV